MELNFTVPEISCGHCKETIEKALDVTGVSNLDINIETKNVSLTVSDGVELKNIESLLDEQGYSVVSK
ncbi:cation transporter [Candidatus Actinomarina sp.]|jgi:copper chaperone|nr:cation transporter [Acidimicrobiia bacterium]MDA7572205.1 cation transporter [bacterium]MDA8653064.1 cation transporter [Candidatus Actinomarina sp.]MDA7548068.1 cation transporter [Acidimicrobiia bacterium]MDA7595111.1 cation transporter [Acidimicrobiia bacterium]|tara:strand:+ start:7579 stop:7782 length:204 start_codon:yes stop_codon:yes gene_type:complete